MVAEIILYHGELCRDQPTLEPLVRFSQEVERFAVAVESKQNVRGRLNARQEPRMGRKRQSRRDECVDGATG